MAVWTSMLELLKTHEAGREIIISPNAPPVGRTETGWKVLAGTVFTSEDVAEVLLHVSREAKKEGAVPLGQSGVFSFGLRDVGRFHVSFVTQRGSKTLRIMRIPVSPPILSDICARGEAVDGIVSMLSEEQGTWALVYGPDAASNSKFVYAILNEINQHSRHLIFVLERSLSYLLAHENSVVIQTELGGELETMEQGLRDAMLINPDILYVGDIQTNEELPSLPQLLSATHGGILSATARSPQDLRTRLPSAAYNAQGVNTGAGQVHTISVIPDADGLLTITVNTPSATTAATPR
jgi:twitching motility protein PilT